MRQTSAETNSPIANARQGGSATSVFGAITRLRQAPDELAHFSQYLGLVRLENIVTRILQ